MRPCNQCGTAISNRDLLCEECQTAATSNHDANPKEPPAKQPKIELSEILLLAAEIVVRSLVVAVPVSLLGFLFFLIIAKPVYAIVAGTIFGVICGLAYTLIAMYFQAGPYHR